MSAGVYMIRCGINGKRYIGSSICIKHRLGQHKVDLRGNRHCNKHLQRSWNKYGEKAFEFVILETTAPDVVLETEQRWLDNEKPEYNATPNAIASPMKGLSLSPEHKAKISNALKGRIGNRRGKKMPADAKERVCEALRGNAHRVGKKATTEQKQKMSEAQKKRWRDHPITQTTRTKLRLKSSGRVVSGETKALLSRKQKEYQQAHGNPMKGKRRPDLVAMNKARVLVK